MIARGTVIRLDDRHTGFDDNKTGRPYCVVGHVGDPPHSYIVTPRSTTGSQGVFSPADVVPGLTQAGRWMWRARPVPAEVAESAEVVGTLATDDLEELIDEINLVEFDLD